MSIELVCLGDTHSLHKDVKVPDGDILIHVGDFSNVGNLEDTKNFLDWFSSLKYQYHILIAGNHDFLPYENSTLFRALLDEYPSIIYLQDNEVKIEGVRFYGSPWTPTFNDWAFMLDRGAEIKTKWNKIPEDTDVLITHGPPNGILDEVYKGGIPWHIGCEELAKAVERIKPGLQVVGHIHDGYGFLKKENTLIVNASICTEDYDPTNVPIIVKVKVGKDGKKIFNI